MSLSSIEGYTVGADVDVVYQDFYDLGRIFQVEDRAEEIVSAMKEQDRRRRRRRSPGPGGRRRSSSTTWPRRRGAYTCGDNFTAKLIAHAGRRQHLRRSWTPPGPPSAGKTVVERAPEVIVINDYGSTSLEEKIEELKENPALADGACHSGRPHHLGDPVRGPSPPP